MLRFQRLRDVLVEFLIRASRLGRVEIASARYVAVGRVKVERARYRVEGGEGKELSHVRGE